MISTATAKAARSRESGLRAALSKATVPIALFVIGAASAGLYCWGRDLHRFTQWIAAYIGLFVGQLAFYAVACYVVTRWSPRSSTVAKWATLAVIIFFAIAFRAALVTERPFLSADVYRYVWDGRVQAAGINPYRYVPDDPALSDLRDDTIFASISSDDHKWLSPYPPAAQAVFWLVSLIRPMSVTAFKAAMSSFDLMTVLLLMLVLARSGIDPARAIIFAWHPLMIFEGAHSGHVEAVFIAFLALALLAWSHEKYAMTGVALALATLVKFYPVLLLPAFIISSRHERARDERERLSDSLLRAVSDRRNLAMLGAFAATVVLAYAPYLSARDKLFGFLGEYVSEEGFVGSGARYFALDMIRKLVPIPTSAFLIVAGICFVIAAAWWCLKPKRSAVDVALVATSVIGLYLILTTPRYAWYYAWMIPFLCLIRRLSWLYLTCASVLLYLVWYTPLVYPEIPLWLGAGIYVPTLALLIWEHRKSRGERAAHVHEDKTPPTHLGDGSPSGGICL